MGESEVERSSLSLSESGLIRPRTNFFPLQQRRSSQEGPLPRRARLVGWLDDDTTVTSSEMFPPLCGGSSSSGGYPTTPGSTLQYSTSGSAKTLARKAFAVYPIEMLTPKHAVIRPGDCSGRCYWIVSYLLVQARFHYRHCNLP